MHFRKEPGAFNAISLQHHKPVPEYDRPEVMLNILKQRIVQENFLFRNIFAGNKQERLQALKLPMVS